MFGLFNSKHTVQIAPSSVVSTLLILIAFYVLYEIRSIILLFFTAFILMVALNPLVMKFQKAFKMPRPAAIALAYVCFLAVLAGLIGLVIPPLVKQLYGLVKAIDVPVLQQQLSEFKFSVTEISSIADQVGTSLNTVFSAVTSTFSGVFTTFTLFVLSFFLIVERPHLHKKIAWFTKDTAHFKKAKEFIDVLESELGGWVRGEVILMVTIATLTYIGLFLLKIPYALPLAILAGFLEILPNIGPTIAAIPAIFMAYITFGPVMALVVAVFSILVQQLENNVIVPKVMKDNANVNPLVSILAILIGLELAGVFGALLAVPGYIVGRAFFATFVRK